eukprot:CAMPEP_0202858864 /NCGR_PEP_ID=MMETSP1391-20130828/1215_1 /ASSEMBLY_ACC=CAM_ASM_000867 /TAXON_ID=1034604 /ORGANISM="Chlamydomonas leiostraca, Strain SAG 11-49" /LENGTH=163 /DNA_ID=CAMNT_0049537829 /DNA_START=66 /DNA_END=553 /DNA_ORIENTATION=+
MVLLILALVGFAAAQSSLYPAKTGDPVCNTLAEVPNGYDLGQAAGAYFALISHSDAIQNDCSSAALALIDCGNDLGFAEGCCTEQCYTALQNMYNTPETSTCLKDLSVGVCIIAYDRDVKEVQSLVGPLTSVYRRCFAGTDITCDSLLGRVPSPIAASPSPPP